MKKLLSLGICIGLFLGVTGCGGNNEPWKDVLEDKLSELGIDGISNIRSASYEDGDEEATVYIETKIAKLESKLHLEDDTWEVFSIIDRLASKYYFLSNDVLNEENYDIHDFKTNEIIRPKAITETSDEVSNESSDVLEVSKSVQFIKNGYKEFTGNYRKDETINGSTMYKLFSFYTDVSVNTFMVSDDSGNSTSYFYNSNYGWESSCKFDFSTNSSREGSTCSTAEIENIKFVKDIFDKEITTLGLTIIDLNK